MKTFLECLIECQEIRLELEQREHHWNYFDVSTLVLGVISIVYLLQMWDQRRRVPSGSINEKKRTEVSTESKPDSASTIISTTTTSSTAALTMAKRDKNSVEAVSTNGLFKKVGEKDTKLLEILYWLIDHSYKAKRATREKVELNSYRNRKLSEKEKEELIRRKDELIDDLEDDDIAEFESRFPTTETSSQTLSSTKRAQKSGGRL